MGLIKRWQDASARQSQIKALAVRTTRTIAREARLRRRIDMAKPQQANCHLFSRPINKCTA